MKKISATFILLTSSLFSAGCSTVMSRPFPDLSDSLRIVVTDKDVYEDDWAPGVYHLANTNICFARGQGQEDLGKAAVLFGLMGAAISNSESAGQLKKLVNGEEGLFTLNLPAITRTCLKNELAQSNSSGRFSTDDNWKSAPLEIIPYTVFSFIGENVARLWVVLRVEWFDESSHHKKWQCRYLVGLGNPRPLTGESGWSANDGKFLESTIRSDTSIALQVMMIDLQGKLRTGNEPKETIGANWMFYKKPLFADIQKLKSGKDGDIILPQVEDEEYFAGVNIVPKDFALPIAPPEKRGGVWGNINQ